MYYFFIEPTFLLYLGWLMILAAVAGVVGLVRVSTRRPATMEPAEQSVPVAVITPERDPRVVKSELLSRKRSQAKATSARLRKQIQDRGSPATEEERSQIRQLGDLSRRMSIEIKKLQSEASNAAEEPPRRSIH